jgi:hypothetical protein
MLCVASAELLPFQHNFCYPGNLSQTIASFQPDFGTQNLLTVFLGF